METNGMIKRRLPQSFLGIGILRLPNKTSSALSLRGGEADEAISNPEIATPAQKHGGLAMTVLLCALMTALTVFQNPAHAKMIRGEVVAVKEDGSSFSFKRSDPSNPSLTEQFDIMVLPSTKFEKISSLQELRSGDEVAVDAEKKNESGTWEAVLVRILKVKLYKE